MLEPFVLPLLTAVGVFALVGVLWNLAEAYFEERREEKR